jgi:diadenosine tetraphosphate (Ap4A) HIT family hydrolase
MVVYQKLVYENPMSEADHGKTNDITCPFCTLPEARIVKSNDHALFIHDGYPISEGHSLIISKRHVGSFFQITDNERSSLLELLDYAKSVLDMKFKPDGYNIGINDGHSAGQTVSHLHIHLIPRYTGDRTDPRGGVRWVIPEKADYWTNR